MTGAFVRATLGVLTTLLVLATLGWASRASYHAPGSDAALLRLSWRMRTPDSRVCRPRTQAELDALPAHMRTPEVCENVSVAYRLEIRVDDAPPRTRLVRPAGARGDRPLFVFDEAALEPGEHELGVRFHREGTDADDVLSWEGRVDVARGEILLVSIDESTGALALRRPGGEGGARTSR